MEKVYLDAKKLEELLVSPNEEFEGCLFGVEVGDILSLELHNYVQEALEKLEFSDAFEGFPCIHVEDGNIVLESGFGFGKEDRVVCSRVYISSEG